MGKEIPYLKEAETLEGYKMHLSFSDGTEGIIDMANWKGKGVFKYWNDEKNFRSFEITKNRKLQWSEDIDMDPDAFYLRLINKSFEEYARDK